MAVTDLRAVCIFIFSTALGVLGASLPQQNIDKGVGKQGISSQKEKAAAVYQVIFEDNLDADNEGRGNLHYRGFKNWFVTRGEVDLVGSGFRYHDSGNNLYVDLNGTPYSGQDAVPVMLQSKEMFALDAGTYSLQFDIACNPQQIEGKVTVHLANVYREVFYLDNGDYCARFKNESRIVSVSKPKKGKLTFEYQGQDWGDILVDNIKLVKSPSHGGTRLNEIISGRNTEAPYGSRKLVRPASTEEPEGESEVAEKILADISDANVESSTEDLKHTIGRLNEICERAVETCDAMLLARFDIEQDGIVSNEKGAENGNE